MSGSYLPYDINPIHLSSDGKNTDRDLAAVACLEFAPVALKIRINSVKVLNCKRTNDAWNLDWLQSFFQTCSVWHLHEDTINRVKHTSQNLYSLQIHHFFFLTFSTVSLWWIYSKTSHISQSVFSDISKQTLSMIFFFFFFYHRVCLLSF